MKLSKPLSVGSPAPAFSLAGVDGRLVALEDFADKQLVAVVFTCNHCPVAVAYEDRLIQLTADYADRGVQVLAINPNDDTRYPADSLDAMKVRAREKEFNFPYLRDEDQSVAHAYGAACTPDVFVFGPERTLKYAGRIDDNWRDETRVTKPDLRTALDRLLSGDEIDFEVAPATGCSIKWKV